jgi:hypothetical protein
MIEDGVIEPSPTPRERLIFWGALGALWCFFLLIVHWSPVMLDDWYQVVYWQRHPFSWSAIWDNGVYNYFNYNPRLGENLLLIVNGPRWIYLLATPTLEICFLLVTYAVVFGQWARGTSRDLRRLLVMLMVVWMVAPIPGIMFFYRPFNTNYVYALTITLLLFVPYRIELARAQPTEGRRWLAPALFVWGICAGMTNEHTGPTVILALGAVVYLLRRKQGRLRPWMIAGLVGFLVGYPLLYFAPGQTLRYGGLATKQGPIEVLSQRGATGMLIVLRGFIFEMQLALYTLAGALLLALRRTGPEPAPTLDKHQAVAIAFLFTSALLIVATLFASPTWGERLFFAPAVLFAGGLMILFDVTMHVRAARRLVLIVCIIYSGYNMVRVTMVYATASRENDERIEVMASTPKGQVAYVKPYTNQRSPWMISDDFGYASLREEVAHEAFGLAGVEFDRPYHAEPSPPYKAVLDYEYEPPLSHDEVERQVHFPLSFVPAYIDRDLQLIHRTLDQLQAIPGHTLRTVTARLVGWDLPELRGRPLLGVRWHDEKIEMIDARRYQDDHDLAYFVFWKGSVPRDATEAYLTSCGHTVPVPLIEDPDGHGKRLTFTYDCRGLYIATVCTPKECWLAATAWR